MINLKHIIFYLLVVYQLSMVNCELKIDLASAIKQYCLHREKRNFCSQEQLKVNMEIIREKEEKEERERVIKINLKSVNNVLRKKQHYRFLKDFMAQRYF